MSRIADALEHMQRAIDKILRFAPANRPALDSDEMRRDSIERNLITLGDAATRVPRVVHVERATGAQAIAGVAESGGAQCCGVCG